MSALGISSDAWAGLIGAVVGGSFTLSAQVVNDRFQRRTAKKAADDQAAATAILMQDDFWHAQSMIARALDRCTWWKPSEELPAQASIDDRKTVYAALPDNQTNKVAAAQGWVDYLTVTRNAMPGELPPLRSDSAETLKMTFQELEKGRGALAKLARRPATSFSESRVLTELANCKTVDDLLARSCPDPSAES